jgi:hypothetical protein
LNALKHANKNMGVKPLPRKLFLQMDNCVKDNKNHHLLAFSSLLIACEVFEEVQLGFLVVGHTHEDIDGSFGYLSKKLKKQNNYVMVDLLKTFMLSQDCPFILQLIQEIFDFNMCPSLNTIAYTPFRDLFASNFVFVRPTNPTIYHVWMGRVESDVVRDQENENYKKVYVQWQVFVRKGTKNNEELYHNCWLNKWKNNHAN